MGSRPTIYNAYAQSAPSHPLPGTHTHTHTKAVIREITHNVDTNYSQLMSCHNQHQVDSLLIKTKAFSLEKLIQVNYLGRRLSPVIQYHPGGCFSIATGPVLTRAKAFSTGTSPGRMVPPARSTSCTSSGSRNDSLYQLSNSVMHANTHVHKHNFSK